MIWDVCDFCCGGEVGMEDEFLYLGIGYFVNFGFVCKIVFEDFFFYFVNIDIFIVIMDFDDDVVIFMIGC